MSAHYTVWPCKGEEIRKHDLLLVCDVFHHAVKVVMVRRAGSYAHCGYVEGDGAIVLRDLHACELLVEYVSEVSGCGQARVTTFWEADR